MDKDHEERIGRKYEEKVGQIRERKNKADGDRHIFPDLSTFRAGKGAYMCVLRGEFERGD